ncbi:outer membrane protein assembly factor BamB family protein [Halocatena marina]|uniref:outer membrane protein assembly factor BamB family protein n=1 Tax=Halocatena marina TaxID=2934937 RepID=UPI00200C3899|nr:PQQ-binding-like beta-propeller repeat protein [Halocatena marina]
MIDRRTFVSTSLSTIGGTTIIGSTHADTSNNFQQLSSATAVQSRPTSDLWPQYQRGPGNTSAAMGASPPTQLFTLAWMFKGASNYPVIDEASAYFVDNIDGTATLFALNRATGSKRWTVDMDNPENIYNGPPASIDGTVYLSGQYTRAFDAADGTELWTVEDSGAGMVATTERLHLATGPRLFTLDRTDGSKIWQRNIGGSTARHAVADQTLYVGSGTPESGSFVIALDAATGERRWRTKLSHEFPRLIATDEHVFAATNTALYGIAADTGDILWSKESSPLQTGQSENVSQPAIGDGVVYAAIGETMYALDRASGDVQWEMFISEYGGGPLVAHADGVVYSFYLDELLVLDAANGSLINTYRGPKGSDMLDFRILVPADERLYLADNTTLYAIAGC